MTPTPEEQLFDLAELIRHHSPRTECEEEALKRAMQGLAMRDRSDLALRLGGANQFAEAPAYRAEVFRLAARAKAVKGDLDSALQAADQITPLLKNDPDNYNVRSARLDALLAVARAALRNKDSVRARAVLTEATALAWKEKPKAFIPLHAYVAMLVSRAGDATTALQLFRKLDAIPNDSLLDIDDSSVELSSWEIYRLRAGFDLPLRGGKSPYPTLKKRYEAAMQASWHPNIAKPLALARAVSDPWARAVILSEVAIRRQVAFGDGTPIVDEVETLLPAALQALQTRQARNLNSNRSEPVGRSADLSSFTVPLFEALASAGRFEAAEKLHGRLTQIITALPDPEYDVIERAEVRSDLLSSLYHAYMAGHVWPRLDEARRQRIIAAVERSDDDAILHMRLYQVAQSTGNTSLMRRMVQKFGATALKERTVTADSPTSDALGLLLTATDQAKNGFLDTANTLRRRAQPLLKRMEPLERAQLYAESGMINEFVAELSLRSQAEPPDMDWDLLGCYAAARADFTTIPPAFLKIKWPCARAMLITGFLKELARPVSHTVRKEEDEVVLSELESGGFEMRPEAIEREEWRPFVPQK